MPRFDAFAYFTETAISQSTSSREKILETMKRYDTTSIALVSSVAVDCDFVTGNHSLSQVVSAKDGIFGYVALNLSYPEESQELQRQYLFHKEYLGAVLFGRPGHPVTLEDASEVINSQRRYTKPVAIHTPDAEAVHEAARIAAEFTGIKFVLLGMGGDDWHAAVTAAKSRLNIYLELSGSLDTDKVSQASTVITARKLLYGSSLPSSDPELIAGLIDDATTLTASDRMRIFSQNSAALFNPQA